MLKSIPKKFTVVSRKFVISNSRQYWPVVDSVEMTWTERANDEQVWKMERSFYSWFVTKVFGLMSWWHLTSLYCIMHDFTPGWNSSRYRDKFTFRTLTTTTKILPGENQRIALIEFLLEETLSQHKHFSLAIKIILNTYF